MSKAIPKLRFKEFNETWLKSDLGEKVNSISSGKIKPLDAGNYNVYGSTGIIGKSHEYSHDGDYLLVARVGANAGMINRVSGKYGVTDNTLVVNLKADILVPFCEGFLTKFNLNKLIFGSGQPLITGGLLKSIKISFPTLPEQQKIASFLSAVDEKIQQLTRKKELLEQYKKGVMQQLFCLHYDSSDSGDGHDGLSNQGNQKNHSKSQCRQLRFKDENGKAYPKWEEKRLGEVALVNMGQSPDSNSYNNQSIGMLLIQGNADISGRVTNPRQWTSEPTKKCEIGDLILTVRAPVGSISKSLHNACIGRGVCSVKNNKTSNIEYLYQFLLDYEGKWKRIEQGSTFTAISGDDIKSIKIRIPSLKEQQKIANFLSAIDTKIESVATQIEKTQTFKKGLLQQMFV
jgi:type I restriction enzyme S subunit